MLPHPEIIQASEIGHVLLIDDGKVKLQVIAKGEGYIECEVVVAGKIKDRKGVNTPDSILEISPLTPKDRADLEYMLQIGVDWVALSFVQRPQDIEEINRLIDALLGPRPVMWQLPFMMVRMLSCLVQKVQLARLVPLI